MTIETLQLDTPCICLSQETTQKAALLMMLEQGLHYAPVCEGGDWVGLLRLRDLLGGVLPLGARMEHGFPDLDFAGDGVPILADHLKDMDKQPIAGLLLRDVPTLRRDHRLMEAAMLLYRHDMPLPVLASDGHMLGLLSPQTLLQYLLTKVEA